MRNLGLNPFHVGERVVAHDRQGVVIGTIDTGEYAVPLKRHTWDPLATGVLVRLDDGMVIHHREPWISLRRTA
jgi:hypothetical protein